MPLDSISEERLNLVCPRLADKIRQMTTILDGESIFIRVTQGLRTWSEQDKLYAQGRTQPGKIVTNAPGGSSWHNFGLAVDIVPLAGDSGRPDWNPEHPVWKRTVTVGESLGLFSGSEFKTFKDWPHFQLTGKFPASPNDEVRQIFRDGGMGSVWLEAFLGEYDAAT